MFQAIGPQREGTKVMGLLLQKSRVAWTSFPARLLCCHLGSCGCCSLTRLSGREDTNRHIGHYTGKKITLAWLSCQYC